MFYFLGFCLYCLWFFTVVDRWPKVPAAELLVFWFIGAVGFLLLDRRWPALDYASRRQRSIWFVVVVGFGLLVLFYVFKR